MKILAALPRDRQRPGALWVLGAGLFQPARCRGEADNAAAATHGNADEDPAKPYGDHPFGLYRVVAVERKKGERFGPVFLRLDPIGTADQAALGEIAGRAGLGIHGGPLLPDRTLRATNGCLRVDDAIAVELADAVEPELALGHQVLYECLELREG